MGYKYLTCIPEHLGSSSTFQLMAIQAIPDTSEENMSVINAHLKACYFALFAVIGITIGVVLYYAHLTAIEAKEATIKRLNGTIQDLEARNKRSEEFALDPYRRDATIQQLNRDLSVCTHSVQGLTDQINDIPECKVKIAH